MTPEVTQPMAPAAVRKQTIGNTLYVVNVHFNPASRESAEEKMKRIIQKACQQAPEAQM